MCTILTCNLIICLENRSVFWWCECTHYRNSEMEIFCPISNPKPHRQVFGCHGNTWQLAHVRFVKEALYCGEGAGHLEMPTHTHTPILTLANTTEHVAPTLDKLRPKPNSNLKSKWPRNCGVKLKCVHTTIERHAYKTYTHRSERIVCTLSTHTSLWSNCHWGPMTKTVWQYVIYCVRKES